jgi:hypothetical protein
LRKYAKRVAELNALYWHRFPERILPDNELGRKWARYIVRTMAALPTDRRTEWLNRHAPWLAGLERNKLLAMGPWWYSAQSLGDRLELGHELRAVLEVTTVRPHDITWAELQAHNKRSEARKARDRRQAKGCKTRDEYLAVNSISRTRPWEAFGIKRRAWERRGKPTPPPTTTQVRREPILVYSADGVASSPDSVARGEGSGRGREGNSAFGGVAYGVDPDVVPFRQEAFAMARQRWGSRGAALVGKAISKYGALPRTVCDWIIEAAALDADADDFAHTLYHELGCPDDWGLEEAA